MSRTFRKDKIIGHKYISYEENKPGRITKKQSRKKERRNLKLTLRRDYV